MTPAAARRLFARERARFAKHFPAVAGATLAFVDRRCIERGRCRDRDLAYAEPGAGRVVLLRRALALPDANVRGLVRHELGHLADPWPGRAGGEQRADDLAEWVVGRRIYYDDQLIQTTGRGTWPRPPWLPR